MLPVHLVIFELCEPSYFMATFQVPAGLKESHLFLLHSHSPSHPVLSLFQFRLLPWYLSLTPSAVPVCVSPTLECTLLHSSCVLLSLSHTHTHTHTQKTGISCTYYLAIWYFSLTVIPLGHVNNYVIFSANAPVYTIPPRR